MKKVLPWVKYLIAISGLYMALHTSGHVRDNYIQKDQMVFEAKTGKELTIEAKDSLRKHSLKRAHRDLFIIWIGVLVSGLWLVAPFTKPHNKAIKKDV